MMALRFVRRVSMSFEKTESGYLYLYLYLKNPAQYNIKYHTRK